MFTIEISSPAQDQPSDRQEFHTLVLIAPGGFLLLAGLKNNVVSQTPKFLGLANSYLVWRISICQEIISTCYRYGMQPVLKISISVRFPGSFCRPVEPLAPSIVMLNQLLNRLNFLAAFSQDFKFGGFWDLGTLGEALAMSEFNLKRHL